MINEINRIINDDEAYKQVSLSKRDENTLKDHLSNLIDALIKDFSVEQQRSILSKYKKQVQAFVDLLMADIKSLDLVLLDTKRVDGHSVNSILIKVVDEKIAK